MYEYVYVCMYVCMYIEVAIMQVKKNTLKSVHYNSGSGGLIIKSQITTLLSLLLRILCEAHDHQIVKKKELDNLFLW